jgi:hypothetical protein
MEMIGKIKVLGLSFVVLIAVSAMGAAGAQATRAHLQQSPAVVTGYIEAQQQHILTIPGKEPGEFFNGVCDGSTVEATFTTLTPQEATATPQYNGSCKLAGTMALVTVNGCHFRLFSAGTPASTQTANADIVCPTGKPIQIKTALCTVDIPAQTNKAHVTFVNQFNNYVTASSKVSGITTVQTGAACLGGNNAHSNAASFSGNTTLTAFAHSGDASKAKDPVDGHEYTRYNHGQQALSFTVT